MRHDPRLNLPPGLRDDAEAVRAAIGAAAPPDDETEAQAVDGLYALLGVIVARIARTRATIASPEAAEQRKVA